MLAGWQSALLVPVPAAEPAVAEHRARLDGSARDGVPAHLTVLYPFLPPALVDDVVLASLGPHAARPVAQPHVVPARLAGVVGGG